MAPGKIELLSKFTINCQQMFWVAGTLSFGAFEGPDLIGTVVIPLKIEERQQSDREKPCPGLMDLGSQSLCSARTKVVTSPSYSG
jgi:hypothetical protein